MFTQFSKNAGAVLAFYLRYFREESLDVAADLKSFFYGYTRNKSHSQMTMICLKMLSEQQTPAWAADREIALLCESLDTAFFDQVMSSRYLCYKYIVRMLSKAIGPATPITQWSALFKIASNMPLELFSTRTTFHDTEARAATQELVLVLGEPLKETICSYLQTLFVTKAMTMQIPKFGKDSEQVLNGLSKLMLVYSETSWLDATMQIICEAFDS